MATSLTTGELRRFGYLAEQFHEPLAEYQKGNLQPELWQQLERIHQNPYLKNGITISGANAGKMINPPAECIEQRRQATVKKLTEIDPHYSEQDYDLDFIVLLVDQSTFQQALDDPQKPEAVLAELADKTILMMSGIAIALQTEARQDGLSAIEQQLILQQIQAGWKQDITPHTSLKLSLSTERPYLLIATDAQSKTTSTQPTNRTLFRHRCELFVESIPISSLNQTTIQTAIQQHFSQHRGTATYTLRTRQFANTNSITFGFYQQSKASSDFVDRHPQNPITTLAQVSRTIKALDQIVFRQPNLDNLPLAQISQSMTTCAQQLPQPLITQTENTHQIRSIWRRLMKQILTRPELINTYLQTGILQLFLGQPNNNTHTHSTLAHVFPNIDLSKLPHSLQHKYRQELQLTTTPTCSH